MKFAVPLLLAVLCGPDVAASHGSFLGRHAIVQEHGRHDLSLLLRRLDNCRSDPQSCGDATDDSKDFSNDMQDKVIEELNATQRDLDNFSFEFEVCDTHRADVDSYRSSFSSKVLVHTQCREMQTKDEAGLVTCEKLQDSNQLLKDAECNSDKLTQPATDVADICTPSNGQLLGPWLESMMNSFSTKYNEWLAQDQKCTGAVWMLGNSTERCNEVKQNVTDQSADCDAILTDIESFACSWATNSASHCSAYETCFDKALSTYNAQVAALPAKILQWKETWVAAEKLKCMADAIDSSGVVDAAKMDNCNNVSSYDTSHIEVTTPRPSQKEACVVPEIYPGSALFHSEVYNPLPVGLKVRDPTLCLSWKGGCAAFSTFAGSLVRLKVQNEYCHLVNSKMVCDSENEEPKMSSDASKSNMKCGMPGNADRTFDFRGQEANEESCSKRCDSQPECAAYSGIFGSWCIGCNRPLDTVHSGAEAFSKLLPQKDLFMFHHLADDGCLGQVSLTTSDQVACKNDPTSTIGTGTAVGVQCGTGDADIPMTATISSNPPATTRTGEVSLSFDAVEVDTRSPLLSNEGWKGQSNIKYPSSVWCSSGALQNMKMRWDTVNNDRYFDYKCTNPKWGKFQSNSQSGMHGIAWTALFQPFTLECPATMVISGVASQFTRYEAFPSTNPSDRQYKIACSTLPVGMSMSQPFPGTGQYAAYNYRNPQDSACPSNAVLVSITSNWAHPPVASGYAGYWARQFTYRCATITPSQPSSFTVEVEYASAAL